MNDSLELAIAIGNPTDLRVVEALRDYCHTNGFSKVRPIDVTGYLVALFDYDTLEQAAAAVEAAITAGQVKLLYGEALTGTPYEGDFVLALDDATALRTARRCTFWLDMTDVEVPAHLPNEVAIVREGIMWWQENYGEAVGMTDLVDAVQFVAGYDDSFWAMHAVLNALDAVQFVTAPEYSGNGWDWPDSPQLRCWLPDLQLETLDS